MLAGTKPRAGGAVTVLPGVAFDVDKEQGLAGFCDCLIARSSEYNYVQAAGATGAF
jgi:hypothetical protein